MLPCQVIERGVLAESGLLLLRLGRSSPDQENAGSSGVHRSLTALAVRIRVRTERLCDEADRKEE